MLILKIIKILISCKYINLIFYFFLTYLKKTNFYLHFVIKKIVLNQIKSIRIQILINDRKHIVVKLKSNLKRQIQLI